MATCPKHIPSPFFPLFSSFPALSPATSVTSFLIARVTPYENMTAAILNYAVSHLHEGTGKLWKTCADTVCHSTESVPSLTVSEKWPPAQRFDVQVAGRRSPIHVLIQRKAFFYFYFFILFYFFFIKMFISFIDAWLGWSRGTGHLPHTEHCRLEFMYFLLKIPVYGFRNTKFQ